MNEITDSIKERLNNSFFGPYALFFIVFNWQIFVMIFTGSEDAPARILNLKGYFADHSPGFVIEPLLGSIGYVFIVPWIVAIVEIYKTWVEVKKINRLERQNFNKNETWKFKFSLVKPLAIRVNNAVTAVQTNGPGSLGNLRDIQKYLDALMEVNGKGIASHYSELTRNRDI